MSKIYLAGIGSFLGRLIGASALLASGPGHAADSGVVITPAPIFASQPADSNFFTRLYHAYADEFGHPPVDDPNAPPSRRPLAEMAPQPETSPPYPFTDWPFGGASTIGATLPNSVDAPLQKALGTGNPLGKALEDAHIQVYGWVEGGGNISTAKNGYGANAPVAYMYSPNLFQLDQAVIYVERLPDTVQKNHIDWGFRVSGIYGENYRYTTALGVFSNSYIYHNHFAGYDMPMVYGELYIPYIADGLLLRAGRYISLPDIEAQLAPNNYMYSHSLTYALDNYTNTGLVGTLKLNKNFMVQLGLSAGTETVPWNAKTISLPNGYVGKRDPGTQPSATGCLQYQTDTANDNLYLCANSINNGTWGYNNLQWYGGTFYHKFNDDWHIALESYYMYEKHVANIDSAVVQANGGPYQGTAFQFMTNAPFAAHCGPTQLQCTAKEWSALAYLNYKLTPMDNLTGRAEFYNDENGQRTGTATRYLNFATGWQHWFSPSIELRPEVAWYHSLDNPAFDLGTRHAITIFSSDLIVHF